MELLIRLVDKQPADHALWEKAGQRGDVVAAMPDGWAWSDTERTNPEWLIVTAEITDIEVVALLEPYRPTEPQYKRRLGVNPDGLQAGDVLTRSELMARIF